MTEYGDIIKNHVGRICRLRMGHGWGYLKGTIESFDGVFLRIKTKDAYKIVNTRQIVYIDVYE